VENARNPEDDDVSMSVGLEFFAAPTTALLAPVEQAP
jgi:hypothetical protein